MPLLKRLESLADAGGDGKQLLDAALAALGWEFGVWWRLAPADGRLHPVAIAESAAHETRALHDETLQSTFALGDPWPGRIAAMGISQLSGDLVLDRHFKRAHGAREAGLQFGLWIPLKRDGEVAAVLEFFGRALREVAPDQIARIEDVLRAHADVFTDPR